MGNANGMGRGLLIAALLVVGLAVAVPANAIVAGNPARVRRFVDTKATVAMGEQE